MSIRAHLQIYFGRQPAREGAVRVSKPGAVSIQKTYGQVPERFLQTGESGLVLWSLLCTEDTSLAKDVAAAGFQFLADRMNISPAGLTQSDLENMVLDQNLFSLQERVILDRLNLNGLCVHVEQNIVQDAGETTGRLFLGRFRREWPLYPPDRLIDFIIDWIGLPNFLNHEFAVQVKLAGLAKQRQERYLRMRGTL